MMFLHVREYLYMYTCCCIVAIQQYIPPVEAGLYKYIKNIHEIFMYKWGKSVYYWNDEKIKQLYLYKGTDSVCMIDNKIHFYRIYYILHTIWATFSTKIGIKCVRRIHKRRRHVCRCSKRAGRTEFKSAKKQFAFYFHANMIKKR